MKFLEALKNKIDFKNNKVRHIIGLVILALQVIATIALFVYLNTINVLPTNLYIIVVCVVILALGLNIGLNITKKLHIVGKVIGVLTTVVLIFGCYYLHHGIEMLKNITTENYDVDNYLVVTLADSKIEKITDVAGKEIGLIEESSESSVLSDVKKEVEKRAGGEVT
ncbi:MAG: hypothetical protein IJV71_09000, partial [Lachnospiraceae bacterium]|nr:hypothetical protein [Lachnospiraceae bacterium]